MTTALSPKEVMMNATLAKYVGLKTEAARIEKEIEQIKSILVPKGSFETSQFVVSVDPQEQMRTISADEICVILDPVFVAEKKLLKTINFNKLTVRAKTF
jgi:hypothetical protein